MRMGRLFMAVLLLPAGLRASETLEDVEKKLMEAHARLKSYTAKIRHVEHVPLTGTDFMASNVDGTVEWLRKGDGILYRMEISGTATQKFGDNETKSHQTSTLVCDGEMFYTYAEQLGQKRFIKQKKDSSIIGNIRAVLDTVRAENDFRLAPDEKVEGADCYTIEVTPKIPPTDDNPIHKTLIYFRKDNGLNVRVVSQNKNGKNVFDHTLVDLKTDVKIDAARFVLKQPADVELIDLTGIEDSPAPAEGGSKPGTPAEPAPSREASP